MLRRRTPFLLAFLAVLLPATPGFADKAATGVSATYVARPGIAIPDNNPTGVRSAIEVTETGAVGRVIVKLDVPHTYIGDLVVTLSHGGVEHTLHDGTGRTGRRLRSRIEVPGFEGKPAQGEWTLSVKDVATGNTGRLNGWTLRLLPTKRRKGPKKGQRAQPDRVK
jgi:subtilisin-like proprotein convertase family protein